jgi:tetratricopeptide (TPR) repeat protein
MRALDLLEPLNDPRHLGELSIDLGNAYSALGPEVREIGVAWYERAIERLLPTDDVAELSRAYHNLGVLVGEVNPQDGLEHLEKAEEAGERAHDSRLVGRALVSGIPLHLALGELEEAERDNEQASHLAEYNGDDLARGWIELNRGLIAERRGLWEEAERAFERTVEVGRRLKIPADEAEAAYRLANLRYKTRDLEGARRAYAVASDLGLGELRPQLAAPFLELARQLGLPASTTPGGSATVPHPPRSLG